MPRTRTGCVIERDKSYYARIPYTDEMGKRRYKEIKAKNRTHAKLLLKEKQREIDDYGPKTLKSEKMSFKDLASYCLEKYYCQALYDLEGRKLSGVRGTAEALSAIKPLIEYFGHKRLRDITHGDIAAYRTTRLKTKTMRGTKRSVATVNRELSKMRRMMNVAWREGWILKNPFNFGDSLISTADERKRERILTQDEEARLLAACATPQRQHLKALIIAALDTGARQGELLSLTWDDVNLERRTLQVTSYKGKTVLKREVYITTRLLKEIEQLKKKKPVTASREYSQSKEELPPDALLVFGITDNVKWSFRSARKEASLEDVRFHDLRHTAASRLVQSHIPLPEVGRILGHTNISTTYRYINANEETIHRAGLAFESFSQIQQEKDTNDFS
jgi:integrase